MNSDLVRRSLTSKKALIDDNQRSWKELEDEIMAQCVSIIALRGAGSANGIAPVEADRLLREELIPLIEGLLFVGEVAILYDGDDDVLDKPDIGYIAGRLLDHFGNNKRGVTFFAVQKRGWYSPQSEGGNITNAHGVECVTYVFEDDTYEGDHSAFSQGERLVNFPGYMQWYIGPSGKIAAGQLVDYNEKVLPGTQAKVFLFRARNNPALDTEIRQKAAVAEMQGQAAKAERLQGYLLQRVHIYGVHWNDQGEPAIATEQFPKLQFSFITINHK